jgi:hypothetical protein
MSTILRIKQSHRSQDRLSGEVQEWPDLDRLSYVLSEAVVPGLTRMMRIPVDRVPYLKWQVNLRMHRGLPNPTSSGLKEAHLQNHVGGTNHALEVPRPIVVGTTGAPHRLTASGIAGLAPTAAGPDVYERR